MRFRSPPWPQWAYKRRTSSSHHEGCERRWSLASARFLGEGAVTGVEVDQVRWEFSPAGKPQKFTVIPGTTEVIPADLVLLAMGFTGVGGSPIAEQLELELTPRNLFPAHPAPDLWATGDCSNGATLVVRAMADAKGKLGK